MKQQAITVVARIENGRVESLQKLLAKVRDEVERSMEINGDEAATSPEPETIRFQDTATHFARWVIVDQDPAYPPLLVFSSNYDGKLAPYLRQLIDAGPGIDEIWQHCRDYPKLGTRDFDAFHKFMKEHSHNFSAFYVSYPGITKESALNALELHDKIQGFLDEEQATSAPRSISRAVERINRFVKDNNLDVLPGSLPRAGLVLRFFNFLITTTPARRNVALIVLAVLLSPLIVLLAIPALFWLWRLRRQERKDREQYNRTHLGNFIPNRHVLEQEASEGMARQNQMTHVVELKPGRLRMFTFKLFVGTVHVLARYVFTQGALGDIRSVQFARWVTIDNQKRLVFFSNFDGSWQNYLSDFIDRAGPFLTGIWTNTVRFPPTRFLVLEGSEHSHGFMQFIRESQTLTDVWYTAYPRRTSQNIVNAVRIRDKIGKRMKLEEQIEWLRRF